MSASHARLLILSVACWLAAPQAGVSAAEPADAQRSDAAQRFEYDAGNRRDPFIPLVRDGRIVSVAGVSGGGPSSLPVLYGIVWDAGGKSIALLNGAEAKVGDTIEGYRVIEIRHDAVVLNSGGDPVVLQINFDAAPRSGLTPRTPRGGGVQ